MYVHAILINKHLPICFCDSCERKATRNKIRDDITLYIKSTCHKCARNYQWTSW